MDYKEKYEEALEQARNYYPDNQFLDTIFPELAESEDEKIRRAIIKSIEEDSSVYEQEVTKEQMLAWLEKQKEQKLVERATMQDFNYHDGEPDKKAWSRLIAILNYAEATSDDTPGEEVQALINWIESKRQVQKPAEWSEKDEKMLKSIINTLGQNTDAHEEGWAIFADEIAWLKSHLPQPNNNLRWRRATEGANIPESIIIPDGEEPRFGKCAVKNSYYIPVEELKELPKE